MGQSAAEKTRGSPERYEAIETTPGPPKGAWRSPNRSSRNQSWGVAPIRLRAKMQVGDRTRTRRHRSSRRRRRGGRGREGRRSWREVRRRQVGRRQVKHNSDGRLCGGRYNGDGFGGGRCGGGRLWGDGWYGYGDGKLGGGRYGDGRLIGRRLGGGRLVTFSCAHQLCEYNSFHGARSSTIPGSTLFVVLSCRMNVLSGMQRHT